jgi:ATP-dependent Clp protease ATP-binding subunit ClpA
MFERFTKKARQVVVLAQEVARERHAGRIGAEHLLLALFRVPDGLALTVLGALGVTREDVEAALDGPGAPDADALATLGIDLDEVRRQAEETFGPGALDRTRAARSGGWSAGHIAFDADAKKALGLALREAIRIGHNYIGTEHLLLGLMHDGRARDLLAPHGVELRAARVIVEELVRRRQAG